MPPPFGTRTVTKLAGASITISDPAGRLARTPDFRIAGSADVRMEIKTRNHTGSGIKEFSFFEKRGDYQINITIRDTVGGDKVFIPRAIKIGVPDNPFGVAVPDEWEVVVEGMTPGIPLTIEALLSGVVTESVETESATDGVPPTKSHKQVSFAETATTFVTVDLVSPEVRISHSAIDLATGLLLIKGTTSDDFGIRSVQWHLDGLTSGAAEDTSADTDWSEWTVITPLPDLSQRHVVSISATDNAGWVTDTPLPPVVAFTRPTIDITTPFIMDWKEGGVTFEFEGVATGGATPLQKVEFAPDLDPSGPAGDDLFQTAEKIASDWATWRAALELDRAGRHTITVRAQDEQGQRSELVVLTLVLQEIVLPLN